MNNFYIVYLSIADTSGNKHQKQYYFQDKDIALIFAYSLVLKTDLNWNFKKAKEFDLDYPYRRLASWTAFSETLNANYISHYQKHVISVMSHKFDNLDDFNVKTAESHLLYC